MHSRKRAARASLGRRVVASAGVLALGVATAVALAAPAAADAVSVDDVTLTWSINNEVGGGAFFGGCNFLSAGAAGNTGSARVWAEADGFYQTHVGNVTIEKPDAGGTYAQPTWATKCLTAAGTPASAASTSSTTGNRVVISGGTGQVDPAGGTASVSWDGDVTIVFYGGLTYWIASDPVLTVNGDGTGTLTATASGYGASMEDLTLWVPLAPRTVTLANLTGVEVDSDGFTVTPDYLGVAVDTGAETPQPAKTSQNEAFWGSFPQDFVDFQLLTGQSSYWYTSGGARDAAKPAHPLTVAWDAATAEPSAGAVTVSQTTLPAEDTSTVTVTGTGFDPSLAVGTRPPLQGQPSGVYVAFGRYLDVWRPSEGAPSDARVNAGGTSGNGTSVLWALPAASRQILDPSHTSSAYADLNPDGTFSVSVQVDPSLLADTPGNFGIYTYAGSGAAVAAYETFTPLTFVDPNGVPVFVEIPEAGGPEPQPGEFTWSVTSGGASLGTATAGANGFTASGSLPTVTVTDTRTAPNAPWSINGRVSDFAAPGGATFGGQALGWTPSVISGDAQAGDPVAPGTAPETGLAAPLTSTLASGTAGGQDAQPVTLGAALSLLAPAATPAGSYTATLTLTAVS